MRQMYLALMVLVLLVGCGYSGVTQTAQTPSFRVTLSLDSNQLGDRQATIEVKDVAGTPVDGGHVTIAPAMPADGMASPEVTATALGAGRYQAQAKLALPMLGEWEMPVRINANGKDETALFKVKIVP